jgi:hypothetical protein
MIQVHICELVRLYLLVIDHALAEYPPRSSPYERFFIAVSGSPSRNAIAGAFGKGLHRHGKIPSANVVKGKYDAHPITSAYVELVILRVNVWANEAPSRLLEGNVFVEAERAHALGWVCSAPFFEDSIEGDLEAWFLQKS